MASKRKPCWTCHLIHPDPNLEDCLGLGNDLLSSVQIAANPLPQNPKRGLLMKIPKTPVINTKTSSSRPIGPKNFPDIQIIELPKYFFSKNNWTTDKEEALETLLKK